MEASEVTSSSRGWMDRPVGREEMAVWAFESEREPIRTW